MSSRMSRLSHLWVHGLVLLACAYVLVEGQDKLFRYKLFPYAVALGILASSVVEWGRQLFAARRVPDRDPAPDPAPRLDTKDEVGEVGIDDAAYHREVARLLAWLAALVAGTIAIGPVATVTVFVLLFLQLEARVAWWKALAGSALVLAMVQGVFIDVLDLQVPEGLLEKPLARFLEWPAR